MGCEERVPLTLAEELEMDTTPVHIRQRRCAREMYSLFCGLEEAQGLGGGV